MNIGVQPVAMLIAAVFTGSVHAQADSPPETQPNMACVEKLGLPAYPVIARAARIEGTITASLLLSPQATVQTIKTQAISTPDGAKGLLIEPVETAIRGATFRSDCHEKTVTMVFTFRIVGVPSDHPKQSVSFGFPNKFWITSEPHTPQP